MKAFTLVKHGKPSVAFQLQEKADPVPSAGQVRIEVEAFGVNFADIMARNGTYKDAPPIPSVIGHEVVGRVDQVGDGVTSLAKGDRVAAFTRFGGYATKVVTRENAVIKIPEDMDTGVAAAMTVQYGTAWYCAEDRVSLFEGDHVLVQAAAGGVGTALVQMAKRRGCIVYGTAGSEEKLAHLREQGVDYPINYRKDDFVEVIKKIRGKEGLDVIFDSLGGREFSRAQKLLGPGGRIMGFGSASRVGGMTNIFGDLKTLLGFRFFSPAFLIMQCKAIMGVNLLRVADHRPAALKRAIDSVLELTMQGVFKPVVGGVFTADQLGEAHDFLESRKSIGKIIVKW